MTLTPTVAEYTVYALAIALAVAARVAGRSRWVIVPLVLAIIATRVLVRRSRLR